MITIPTPPSDHVVMSAKRRKAVILGGSTALVAIVTVGILTLLHKPKAATPLTSSTPHPAVETGSPTPAPTPTPATTASHLNGVPVATGSENLRPLAVMVENTPDARPQAGLSQASMVYEAIAEGGITRFMAVFGNASTPVKVGPVRSARPYYVDFASELGALYAHAGGSQDGLAEIPKTGVPDLDGLAIGSPVFYRSNPHGVAYEHTLYSSTDALWNYAKSRWPTTGSYAPWLFATAPAAPASATKIKTSVSYPEYDTEWDYDAASNSYKRLQAGVPHIDMNTGQQITAKDVILQTVVRVDSTERYGSIVKPISYYTLTGSGTAVIFQNGQALRATWKKSGNERTRYYDAATGAELSFVPGEIWVQLVESGSRITY